ncbi:MAG: extracellular matrix regulator RemB [Syntrophomonadales bacterium]|jgi:hypothetical protein
MFIHLGSDHMISSRDIIAILNIDSYINISLKEIIEIAIAERNFHPICSRERAKSLVVTTDTIYLSPISSITLFKRSQTGAKGGIQ